MIGSAGLEMERRALRELIARGRHGAVAAWVHGPMGSGKSELLAWVVHTAGARVVRAACHPADHASDFAVVHQLIRHLQPQIEQLSPELASPLRELLSGWAPAQATPVSFALLELFSLAAAEGPLVVTVDDAQWMDDSSSGALAFVARRASVEPLTLVIAARAPHDDTRWAPQLVVPLRATDGETSATSNAAGRISAVQNAYDSLSEDAQRVVALASLQGPRRSPLAASVTRSPTFLEALREATAAGLLDHEGSPLPGIVELLCASTDSIVRQTHDELAEQWAELDPVRAFLHRAQGHAVLDEAQLFAADALAHSAATAGRVGDAIAVLSASARHHADPARRCECFRLAGVYEGSVGHWSAALPWLERAMDVAPSLEWRCIVQRTKSWIDMWTGGTVTSAARALSSLLEQLPERDVTMPDEIARAWASLIALWGIGDMYAAIAAARRAPQHPLIDDDRIITALFSLDLSVAPAVPNRQPGVVSLLDLLRTPPGLRVEALLMAGEWESARHDSASEVVEIRQVEAWGALGPAVSRHAMASVFCGDAKAAFGEALATIELLPNDGSLLNGAAYAGAVVGARRAAEWAERCLDIGRRHGITNFVIDAEHNLGLIRLASEQLPEAHAHLLRCHELMREHGYHHPGFAYARGNIAEVAAVLGDHDTARTAIEELEVVGYSSDWTRGLAQRARGVLGEAGAFARSLELVAASPWEVARTHLAWARAVGGEEGSLHAQQAADLFLAMGALPWGELARRRMSTADEEAHLRVADPLEPLSERERTVALAVASGLSNKEAARQLFVSIKTIEAHLQAVYRKLGLTSRTQLVALCLS